MSRRVDDLLRAFEPGRKGDHLAARDADVRRERVRRRRDRAAPDDRVVGHGFLLQAIGAKPAAASAARSCPFRRRHRRLRRPDDRRLQLAEQRQAGLQPRRRASAGRVAVDRDGQRIDEVMQAPGRRPVGAAGGGVEVGAEPGRDRREADLAAGAADEVARQQMLVAGAHHHEIGPHRQQLPPVRLVGGDLPAAVLDADTRGSAARRASVAAS